ncbi:hypothetical protein BN938_2155 [Mucinivorans hirudinis]|uniref:Uncharacterized protein n=1 Tax=Mucinivorans hirudinis TaxID=1433126 RepID=A0A060RDH6_9BACT|nr:hypothetical protein BN938_2155 [Mucinivorans hirudinis]
MKKYLIFATLVAMVFVGCKKNTTAPPKKPTEKPVAAKFSGNILKSDVTTITTKTVTGPGWRLDGYGKVGVSMFPEVSERNADNVLADNIPYSISSDGDFKEIENAIYFPKTKKVDFVAYYPFSDKVSAANPVLEVDFSDQSTPILLGNTECFWADITGQTSTNSTLNFNFKRAQGLFVVRVDEGSSGHERYTKWIFSLENMPTRGLFDVKAGKISIPEKLRSASIKVRSYTFNIGRYPNTTIGDYYTIANIPPHQNAQFGSRFIRLTSPDGETTYDIPFKEDVEAGKQYDIKIELQESKRFLMTTSITDWIQAETNVSINE